MRRGGCDSKHEKRDLIVDSDEDDEAEPAPQRASNIQFHVTRPSLLSSEASKSTYRGLVNVGMMALILTNLKPIVLLCGRANLWCREYLLEHTLSLIFSPWRWPMLMLVCTLNVFITVTYLAEKLAVQGIEIPVPGEKSGKDIIKFSRSTRESAVLCIHTCAMTTELALPPLAIFLTNPHPVPAVIVTTMFMVWFLKHLSYVALNYQERCSYINAHVRYICKFEDKRKFEDSRKLTSCLSSDTLDRSESMHSTDSLLDLGRRKAEMLVSGVLPRYPANVTLGDIYYFVLCPTLCYDLNFPRSRRVRVIWLARRTGELAMMIILMQIVIQHKMLDVVDKLSFDFPSSDNLLFFIESWSEMLIINLMVWLMGFYAFFHLFLNILSESLHFGDRLFYMDFWNATSIDHFWRAWSIPGHRWMVRHVYGPLVKSGYSRAQASGFVFVISAMMHEYTIGVSFQQFKFLAFGLIALQVPFAIMTQSVKGTQVGNLVFWLNMIFGPHCFCTLMYSLEYIRSQEEAAANLAQ